MVCRESAGALHITPHIHLKNKSREDHKNSQITPYNRNIPKLAPNEETIAAYRELIESI